MLGRTISLRILFLLAVPGSLAGPSLTPAPLFYLDMASHPPAQGDTVKFVCIAPSGYKDSEFWLLRVGQAQPVQKLFASEAQHHVTFVLGNITRRDAGQYRCCYHSYNRSARQASQLSNVVQIEVAVSPPPATPTAPLPSSTAAPEGSTWLLPVTLGVAGVLLLSVGLVVAVVAVRRVNSRRRQLKRDQDSCWTERNFPTTDMSFDNCLFTVSVPLPPCSASLGWRRGEKSQRVHQHCCHEGCQRASVHGRGSGSSPRLDRGGLIGGVLGTGGLLRLDECVRVEEDACLGMSRWADGETGERLFGAGFAHQCTSSAIREKMPSKSTLLRDPGEHALQPQRNCFPVRLAPTPPSASPMGQAVCFWRM